MWKQSGADLILQTMTAMPCIAKYTRITLISSVENFANPCRKQNGGQPVCQG